MRASVLLLCVLGASAQYWDSADDQKLADAAVDRKEDLCGEEQVEIDEDARDSMRASLESMSADNILLKAMKESEDQDDFGNKFAGAFSPGFMVLKAGPLGFSIFVLVVYFMCCCWTCCPCCSCCRCCKKERDIPKMYKFVVVALLGLLLAGMLVAALNATGGFADAHTGAAKAGCEAAKLVDVTLSGQNEPAFLGLKRTLVTFEELKDKLQEDSDFITGVKRIMSDTKDISDAVTLASETMTLLIDMMNDEANLHPKDDLENELLHTCKLCGPLSEALTEAKQALDDSTGTALNDARGEVDKQLSGESLDALATSMDSAAQPLVEFKDLLHSAFGPLVLEDTIPSALDRMESQGTLGSVTLILGGFALMACAFCAMGCWIFMDKEKEQIAESPIEEITPESGEAPVVAESSVIAMNPENPENAENDDQPINPPLPPEDTPEEKVQAYRGHTRWCACITWCCACYYIMFAFLIGGILTALTFPLASFCLIMEDVDSQMLTDIQGATGMNMSDEAGQMMGDMIDQCFQGLGDQNPVMLKIIKVTENGTTSSMYEKVVHQTRDQIQQQFDNLASSSGDDGGDFPKLNTNDEVKKLKQLLRKTYIDGMMFLDESAKSNFDEMVQDTNLAPHLLGSARCADFQIPTGLGLDGEGETIRGIQNFTDTLMGYGTQNVPLLPGRCAQDVICDPSAPNPNICDEANELMSLKARLENATTFKCKMFKKDTVDCDPNVPQDCTCDPAVTLDCFNSDGMLTHETFDCDLATFTQMVNDFATRLNNVFAHLDNVTAEFMPKISNELKQKVDGELMDPITAVADGLTCGFLKHSYHGTIEGMCYGMVIGLKGLSDAYVLCACMAFLLILVMYPVWRIANDNVTKDQWQVSPYEPGEPGEGSTDDLRNLANAGD